MQGALSSPLADGRAAVKSMNGKLPPSGRLANKKLPAGKEMRLRCRPRCLPEAWSGVHLMPTTGRSQRTSGGLELLVQQKGDHESV